MDSCLAKSALGGLLVVDLLIYLGFRVVGCRWVWGGYGAMGDGFGGFRSAVGGGFGWVDKVFFFFFFVFGGGSSGGAVVVVWRVWCKKVYSVVVFGMGLLGCFWIC